MNIIKVTEHSVIPAEQLQSAGVDLTLLPTPGEATPGNYMGLSVSGWPKPVVTAGYYIGVSWLSPGKSAVAVLPKIDGIDFMRMFLTALNNRGEDIQDKLLSIYGINFNAPGIAADGVPIEVTPMLMLHFIRLLSPIVTKGLKHNYTQIEENLHGTIKGKLLLSPHIKHNIMRGIVSDNYCRHQRYGENCIENRILRCALDVATGYLARFCSDYYHELQSEIIRTVNKFAHIENYVTRPEVTHHRVNPLFRDYARALRVARMILRRYDYDIRNVEGRPQTLTPPFWIDMPLLFELYTLSLLRRRYGSRIRYHITSRGNEIDFAKPDERLIIDAKYRQRWRDMTDHDNIRQLSGYARNISLRRKLLGYEDTRTIFPCMIAYPDADGADDFMSSPDSLLEDPHATPVDSYLNFSKLGIRLPVSR